MNILLGLTGSVATKIAPKIIEALEAMPNCKEVRVIMTDKARMFWDPSELSRKAGVKVYTEQDEWTWKKQVMNDEGKVVREVATCMWEKDFPVLHVDLAKWASCLVIAPATANTIGKMANGLCDNLLTSVFTAWDSSRPVIVAPSMNTRMLWESRVVRNISTLREMGVKVIHTVKKKLACGDVGDGALADAKDIADEVSATLEWGYPLGLFSHREDFLIPVEDHPGSFGFKRKHDRHCGVDLYCKEGDLIYAVEGGRVVAVEDFTGEKAGCPWWNDTKAVKVEGPSGVVCYGEISPNWDMTIGKLVTKGSIIGHVTPVLKPEKHRKDIPGHSCSMLHLQMYEHGTYHLKDEFDNDAELPDYIIDPTPYLVRAAGNRGKLVTMKGTK